MRTLLMALLLATLSAPALASDIEIYVRQVGAEWGDPVAVASVFEADKEAIFQADPAAPAACSNSSTPSANSVCRSPYSIKGIVARSGNIAAVEFELIQHQVHLKANVPLDEAIAMNFTKFEPTGQIEVSIRTLP